MGQVVSASACSRRVGTLGGCRGQLVAEATAAPLTSARAGVLPPNAHAVLAQPHLLFTLLCRHTAFLHFPSGSFKEPVPGGRHLTHLAGWGEAQPGGGPHLGAESQTQH